MIRLAILSECPKAVCLGLKFGHLKVVEAGLEQKVGDLLIRYALLAREVGDQEV